jgi:predicted amidophosphoribosyltransferase
MPTPPVPKPAGFPGCARCPVRTTATPSVCTLCVAQTNSIPPRHCDVCARPLSPSETCGNPLCGWSNRHVRRVEAICLKTGPIDKLLKGFKYGTAGLGWRVIFGRLLLGWLQQHHHPDDYDLIVVNPTHPDRPVRHMELILDAAANEDLLDEWPFDRHDPRAILKTQETPPSASQRWKDKKIASDALWQALQIPDRQRTAGKRILVVDDITTTLLQLNAVAGILQTAGGADTVDGLVLARAVLQR